MNNNIIWISLDPVNRKINFYPIKIARKIESDYIKKKIDIIKGIRSTCNLGKDFYNATIHFNDNEIFFQTTPGYPIGILGYKQPGYRSVKRIILDNEKSITINVEQIYGEYRISNEKTESITEKVPSNVILKQNIEEEFDDILPWNPKLLELIIEDNVDLEKNVIIWQWCQSTIEKKGNLMNLNDEYWIPYLFEQNKQIEAAYINNKLYTIITLDWDQSERKIKFIKDSSFGIQIDNKERLIRRKVITIKELQQLFFTLNNLPIDVSILPEICNNEIPYEFICSISQDIIIEPVKTIDGFTYDRQSIEKWFKKSNISPLTGLELESKILIPNLDLKKRIKNFTILTLQKNINK